LIKIETYLNTTKIRTYLKKLDENWDKKDILKKNNKKKAKERKKSCEIYLLKRVIRFIFSLIVYLIDYHILI